MTIFALVPKVQGGKQSGQAISSTVYRSYLYPSFFLGVQEKGRLFPLNHTLRLIRIALAGPDAKNLVGVIRMFMVISKVPHIRYPPGVARSDVVDVERFSGKRLRPAGDQRA